MDRIEIELNCKDYLNMNIPFDQLEEPDPWDGKEIELYHKRVVAEIERGNEPFENEEEESNDDTFYSDEESEKIRKEINDSSDKSIDELKKELSKYFITGGNDDE